jgi:glycosyltransferase involved in cell wall biosynthesis
MYLEGPQIGPRTNNEVSIAGSSMQVVNGETRIGSTDGTVLIAARVFGASGQPWLWRQVVGLQRFCKGVVCWEQHNHTTQSAGDILVHVLKTNPAPYDGVGRWSYRFRNLCNGNFYATLGEEKQRLRCIMRQSRPTVLLCNFGDIAMRLLPIGCELGIPVVAYFHDAFSFLSNRWYRWSLYRCLRRFASIIVVTESERQWMVEHGAREDKVHVIPCGAPTDIFRPDHKRDGVFRFVMVSRLNEEKGCDVSINAFSEIARNLPHSQLHIYGDGPARKDLTALVERLKLEDRIFFHGYVEEKKLAETLPLHDVFIQHSRRTEGSPVSIAEAMACGLAIVATPVGGISEQIIHNNSGLLVKRGDVQGMAAAMCQLAVNPELKRRVGEAARERAVALYDSSRQRDRLEKILSAVAAGGSSRIGIRESLRPFFISQSAAHRANRDAHETSILE